METDLDCESFQKLNVGLEFLNKFLRKQAFLKISAMGWFLTISFSFKAEKLHSLWKHGPLKPSVSLSTAIFPRCVSAELYAIKSM